MLKNEIKLVCYIDLKNTNARIVRFGVVKFVATEVWMLAYTGGGV